MHVFALGAPVTLYLDPAQALRVRRRRRPAGRAAARRARSALTWPASTSTWRTPTSRNPQRDEDYALLPLKMSFEDGGAYALLGPSGCGKTTLLNIISGLVHAVAGHASCSTARTSPRLTPQQRNIAQVFQFPVIYDTMTVAENLAFPLRNRGVRGRAHQAARRPDRRDARDERPARACAPRAWRPTPKQKISLGRGLVREDVAAVLFDEPLTVIDPHLKWQLRRKLKQIHHELKLTLIYVTHDQVEALTFAEQVVVMTRGRAVQIGTPSELFERPRTPSSATSSARRA